MYGPQGYWVNGPLPGLSIRSQGLAPSSKHYPMVPPVLQSEPEQGTGSVPEEAGVQQQGTEQEHSSLDTKLQPPLISCVDLTAGSPTEGESPPLCESPPPVSFRETTHDSQIRKGQCSSELGASKQIQPEGKRNEKGAHQPEFKRPYPWEGPPNLSSRRSHHGGIVRPKPRRP